MAKNLTVADVIAHLSAYPLDTTVMSIPSGSESAGHLCFQANCPGGQLDNLMPVIYEDSADFHGAVGEVMKVSNVSQWVTGGAFADAFPTNAREMTPFVPEHTIQRLVEADLWLEAHHMQILRAAWRRTLLAYHSALAILDDEAISQLHVVTHTIHNIWGPLILGVPLPDRELSKREHAADLAYHRYGPDSR